MKQTASPLITIDKYYKGTEYEWVLTSFISAYEVLEEIDGDIVVRRQIAAGIDSQEVYITG